MSQGRGDTVPGVGGGAGTVVPGKQWGIAA